MRCFTRLLAAFLLLVMLCAPLLTACGKAEEPIEDVGKQEQSSDTVSHPESHPTGWVILREPTQTQNGLMERRCRLVQACGAVLERREIPVEGFMDGRVKDDLPDSLDYQGEHVRVLYWSDTDFPEFEQSELTGDNVADAIYTRNLKVEYRLNVDLDFTGMAAAYGGARESFLTRVAAAAQAGTREYDIIATHSRTQGALAVQGCLQNMAAIEDSYIDPEKPWWPDQLMETVSFGNGAYYFVSGDISTNVLYAMQCIFVNKDLCTALSLDVPYRDVRDGVWTVDRLIQTALEQYQNIDGGLGFYAETGMMDAFYTGANLCYVEKSADGSLHVSADYTDQKAKNLVELLGDFAASNGVRLADGDAEASHPFLSGRSLFCLDNTGLAGRIAKEADFKFGILPVPKGNATQLNYYTAMSDSWTLYGIFSDFDTRGDKGATLTMLSAVLECWASEAYRLTTPAIFEVNMQMEYAEGQDERDMFEYVRSGIVFDCAEIFDEELGEMAARWCDAVLDRTDWGAVSADYASESTKGLDALLKALRK